MLRVRIVVDERLFKSFFCTYQPNCVRTPKGYLYFYPMAVINVILGEETVLPKPMGLPEEEKHAVERLCRERSIAGQAVYLFIPFKNYEYFLCLADVGFYWDIFER